MFFPSSKKNVLILGYKKAGKSTIVEQLTRNQILRERREETHGSKTKEISITLGDISHDFKITDVGGSKEYQDMFWKADIVKADGIVYVIDSSLLYSCDSGTKDPLQCPNRDESQKIFQCGCSSNTIFKESRMAKSFAFSILDTGKPLLIFLNKTDLADKQQVYNQEEMTDLYKLNHGDYNTRIETGSALVGTNVFEAIGWLFSEMEK